MPAPILSAQSRQQALTAMTSSEGLDILVVGGGITGAGIALDAATRGLKVGLIESQDWSAGTSSRSSKLVHGGLRYLEMLDFHLVREALRERELLLHTLAPHLVKPAPFFYPILHRFWERPYVSAGIGLYDLLARVGSPFHSLPMQRHYSRRGVKRAFPSLREDSLVGAVKYWDGKVDDARLVIALVRTAAKYGALAASRCELVKVIKNDRGRVAGAEVLDLETGQRQHIKTRAIITATGVWTEQTQTLADSDGGLEVLCSKGIHIVVPRERIEGEVGFILQTEKSVLFIIPWKRYWLIGTTDTPYNYDLKHPVATQADIDYVIEHANVVLEQPLTRDDVVGSFAGLRPLLQPGTLDSTSVKSTKVSREHTVTEVIPGMTVIAGGKLTSYRVMAKDAVDFTLGKYLAGQLPSLTATTPLVGAVGYPVVRRRRAKIATQYGWDIGRVEDLLDRYGTEIETLLELVDARPDLGQPLAGAPEYLRAEIAFALQYEGALHVEDLLKRRMRLSYENKDRGLDAAPEVAELAAEYLGWSPGQAAAEVSSYAAQCAAVRAALAAPTEAEAQRLRVEVTDPLPFEN